MHKKILQITFYTAIHNLVFRNMKTWYIFCFVLLMIIQINYWHKTKQAINDLVSITKSHNPNLTTQDRIKHSFHILFRVNCILFLSLSFLFNTWLRIEQNAKKHRCLGNSVSSISMLHRPGFSLTSRIMADTACSDLICDVSTVLCHENPGRLSSELHLFPTRGLSAPQNTRTCSEHKWGR